MFLLDKLRAIVGYVTVVMADKTSKRQILEYNRLPNSDPDREVYLNALRYLFARSTQALS